MDLRDLTKRLKEREYRNVIVTFENGKVVSRTHKEVYADVAAAVARLFNWGVRPGMRVGILAPNCYQWIIFDLALIELRAISIAFTDDFAGAPTEELFTRYSLSLLLLSSTKNRPESNLAVAFMEGDNGWVKALDIRTSGADPDFDCPGLIFSSGSSGRLKGLTLNRRGIEASVDAFTEAVSPRKDDCLLLFLPISNFQQRLMYYSAIWYGFDLIVTDPTRLFRALKDLHPTVLIAPPMLYESFETRFLNLPNWKQRVAKIAGGMAGLVPNSGLKQKLATTIFKEAYEALGGKMRVMVTGMAPIRRSTLELFKLMQLPLFETYGMIEFGGIALNLPGNCRIGSVGKTLPGVQLELTEEGEIIAVREHSIASGYFECGEGDTENTFVGKHRIATGDIGYIDKNGYLYLTGRKKEIIVTAGGEKVHPEVLESEIEACPEVARAVVFGTADALTLTAVVLPRSPESAEARQRIEQFIDHISERRRSTPITLTIFTDIAFNRDNGFLRPNLKLDRKRIAEHFLAEKAETPAEPPAELATGVVRGR
jgi:long-chain acyl-CoA synthetase